MSRRQAFWLSAAAVAVGALLRALPITGDLWLDEIWSYDLARGLASPGEVFTSIHHSNNHHLNTLIFYAFGDLERAWLYRLPALLAGIASVALAAGYAARRGPLEAVLAAWLTALCFALVHFSSEARGYAPALAFALLALWALQLDLERPRLATAALFSTSVVLGLLSQLVFLFFYAGALAQSAWRVWSRGEPALRRLARLHALPLASLALLAWLDLREFELAGAWPYEPAWFASRLAAYTLGLPALRSLALPYTLLLALPVALGLRLLIRERDDSWLCFALAIAVAPAATIALLRPDVVAIRYFLIGIALTLLLAANVLAAALRAGGARRALALASLAVFFVGNAVHIERFVELGRGGYRAALLTMAEGSPGPRIVVGGRQDFRNETVLRFYARELPPGKTLDYRARGSWPVGGPEWFIWDRAERPEHILPRLEMPGGLRFDLVAEFDHAAISGFYWALYHRSAGPAPP